MVNASLMYEESFWDFKGKAYNYGKNLMKDVFLKILTLAKAAVAIVVTKSEDFIDEWLFMSSPVHVLFISAVYLLFVLKIGPEFMKNRNPFKLNNLLLLYNASQVLLSCYMFDYGIRLLWPDIFIQKNCMVERNQTKYLAAGMHLYFLAKVSELLDTVFFVLRKKNNQITFLHVYHHTIMMLSSWMTLKYEPNTTTVFLGTLNSFVHVIMYSYYGLSAIPRLNKYLWWKKYITTMQLIQFAFIIVQAVVNYMYSSCLPSYLLLYTIIFNAALFVYLFGDFYIRAYLKNQREKSMKAASLNGSRAKNKQPVKLD